MPSNHQTYVSFLNELIRRIFSQESSRTRINLLPLQLTKQLGNPDKLNFYSSLKDGFRQGHKLHIHHGCNMSLKSLNVQDTGILYLSSIFFKHNNLLRRTHKKLSILWLDMKMCGHSSNNCFWLRKEELSFSTIQWGYYNWVENMDHHHHHHHHISPHSL